MTDNPLSPTEEENAAVARLGFTDDGRLLHRYLRRVLETCEDFAESSTLLAHNGRRSLARDLMRLMAEGIEASSGRPGTDQSILTRSRGPAAVSAPRGARGFRRLAAAELASESGPDDTGTGGAA